MRRLAVAAGTAVIFLLGGRVSDGVRPWRLTGRRATAASPGWAAFRGFAFVLAGALVGACSVSTPAPSTDPVLLVTVTDHGGNQIANARVFVQQQAPPMQMVAESTTDLRGVARVLLAGERGPAMALLRQANLSTPDEPSSSETVDYLVGVYHDWSRDVGDTDLSSFSFTYVDEAALGQDDPEMSIDEVRALMNEIEGPLEVEMEMEVDTPVLPIFGK